MKKHFRRRPSPSLIIAMIALFVALGQGASASHLGSMLLGHENVTGAATTGVAGARAGTMLYGRNTSAGAGALGVTGRAAATAAGADSAGVRGINDGTNANGSGVWGSHAGSGNGVLGQSTALGSGVRGTGGYGGFFASLAPNGIGALGTVTGAGYGVRGEAGSGGVGVIGKNAGDGTGVRGEAPTGSFSRGVEGVAGSGYGGYFTALSAGGYGVYARGGRDGVVARSDSASGSGVRGVGGNGGSFSSSVANGTGVVGTVTGAGHGVRGEAGSGGSGVVGKSAADGFAFRAEGNASQSRATNGWVKAMLKFNPFNTSDKIQQCYNSQLPPQLATTGDCGIAIVSHGLGSVTLDVGFEVSDRFLLVTAHDHESFERDPGIVVSAEPSGIGLTSKVWVTTAYNGGPKTNEQFYLIVF
ncbi:MAG: hypothetical protein ABR583_10050 [Gaiellaceae bacterium]